jgi:uncharacterized membrane protein
MEAAGATKKAVAGEVPPRSQQWWQGTRQTAQQPAPQARATVAEPDDPAESRALVALGYPLFPLAVLALFDRKQSRRLRKHAYQAIGFNLGMAAIWTVLWFIVTMPVLGWTPIGWSSGMLLAFMLPIWIVASVYYGIKAWHGDDARIPIITDWLDDRMPA